MYCYNEFYDCYDKFVDRESEVDEEYLEDEKDVELKVSIKSGIKGRTVYIKNGRHKKVKSKD